MNKYVQKIFRRWGITLRHNERGMSLLESLAAISILSVVGLSLTYSTIASYKLTHRNIRNSVAAQLALEKMEEMAARNPSTLSSADNELEEKVLVDNMSFSRNTEIEVNVDGSRTIFVDVETNNESLGGRSSVVNTFALWGSE
jgi:prepilin-type N-terminal cleavage/methylation domain-containing protein